MPSSTMRFVHPDRRGCGSTPTRGVLMHHELPRQGAAEQLVRPSPPWPFHVTVAAKCIPPLPPKLPHVYAQVVPRLDLRWCHAFESFNRRAPLFGSFGCAASVNASLHASYASLGSLVSVRVSNRCDMGYTECGLHGWSGGSKVTRLMLGLFKSDTSTHFSRRF